MLNITQFTFNAFQENTYLITNDEQQCWIVDPGMYHKEEVNELIKYIESKQLQPQAVINTHAHLDHVFGVQAMKDHFKIPFGLHKAETPVLEMGNTSAAMFGFDAFQVPEPDYFIPENVPLQLGDDRVEIFFTPGHSPGSISFYYAPGNWVISGDVLFSGSIGRTDLPGGSFDVLIKSIKTQLLPLPGKTRVFSGHGPETTIETEQKHNPFLQ